MSLEPASKRCQSLKTYPSHLGCALRPSHVRKFEQLCLYSDLWQNLAQQGNDPHSPQMVNYDCTTTDCLIKKELQHKINIIFHYVVSMQLGMHNSINNRINPQALFCRSVRRSSLWIFAVSIHLHQQAVEDT